MMDQKVSAADLFGAFLHFTPPHSDFFSCHVRVLGLATWHLYIPHSRFNNKNVCVRLQEINCHSMNQTWASDAAFQQIIIGEKLPIRRKLEKNIAHFRTVH